MNFEEQLVDFHCHLDLYPQYEELIAECERSKISTLAVTTTPRAWPRNRELVRGLKYVQTALGLHPQLIDDDFERELVLWESYLLEADFVGEVGLDAGANFVSNLDRQKKVFRRIIECCSEAGGKILSVHSVRSATAVMDIFSEFKNSDNKYILHWFSGSLAEMKKAVILGCYFSINSSMLNSAKGRALVNEMPIDRILTETDGPFVLTEEGNPFTPKQVGTVLEKLAKLLQYDKSELRNKINENLKSLFHR